VCNEEVCIHFHTQTNKLILRQGLTEEFQGYNYNKPQNCVQQVKVVWYLDDDGSIYETTPHVGSSGVASNRIMKVAGTCRP